MKKIFTFTIILLALIACTVAVRAIIGYFSVTQATSDSTATDMPQAGIPNPASVYCEQNGNKLEIQTASDGSQSGVCVFPDGSTCDEWAYFRGECGLAQQKSPTPAMTVRQPQMQAVVAQEETVTRVEMVRVVTCRQVLQKK